ncbi:hypothetical protein BLNAU_24718 [Blattamonas nauphoetae]|uniref:Uncharacterized protein n=1 Tax=Blattamonas nauphoetae TaxID=2049346 RepID=A0ABQ9WLN1_9EUKA|nr:hypothetical protein BLNAU_24718 [Blattamonas nauphoetae]
MNKIPISILDTQDILTVLNTFSFQHPFPQLRKAQCFPITGCERKNQHICILVDQAPLPHVFLLSRPTSPSPAIRGRQFPQQLTGQTHESSFQSRLCRAEVSERCPYDWRLVNVNDNPTFPSDKDLKTLVEPAFRANNNKNVVLCGHSTDDIITHRFLQIGALTINILTRDRASLHWMIPNKNTFDDDLRRDNVCEIIMKNMTWTDNKAGKACVKTTVQRTRNNTDQPLVLPKVMTHVMYSIGINATAEFHAFTKYWTDMSHRILILRHEGRSVLILRVILHLLMDNTSNQSESQNFYGTEDKIEDARIHPSHITTSHSITPECLSETKSCSWPSGPGQTSSLSTIDAATVEFEHQDSPNVAANQ